ncbi:MAG: FtsB family cell division protein [Anaeromyxobacteraceae bacterium]
MATLDRRRATYGYLAVLAALLAWSALDANGLRHALKLDGEAKRLDRETAEAEARVARLRRDVKALRGDPAALERAAREDLGYVRPGEVIYKLDEARP